eukprot:CAMPEP_0198138966 /NCGR_PEP_ID=MMETSP1443-20131203/2311_1 /TAXON_ID=186043 /ORGANISM="Entomoneis sp., Strain CCMP2396" /LENGTH=514 /DNA_ID=CAMNT_0043800923 /DNA_START=73 /DNA_END=1617 /DNA_ORIENTATION=+
MMPLEVQHRHQHQHCLIQHHNSHVPTRSRSLKALLLISSLFTASSFTIHEFAPIQSIQIQTRSRSASTGSATRSHNQLFQLDELVHEKKCINYLELYAGVGGWRMALEQAIDEQGDIFSNSTTRCVAALDHSDLCTTVYRHNFDTSSCGSKQSSSISTEAKTTGIEKITKDQLTTTLQADVWFASPPCQPHTRQHNNQEKEKDDPRSQSFLHLCKLLEKLDQKVLPRLIFVENVVQFESSRSCQDFRTVLKSRNFHLAEFHLTPTQVQLPNDRPRYFCVAVRLPSPVAATATKTTETTKGNDDDCMSTQQLLQKYFSSPNDTAPPKLHTSIPELGVTAADSGKILPQIKEILDQNSKESSLSASQSTSTSTDHLHHALRIPNKVLERNSAWCFDIVNPQSTRSACFTSGYGRFIKGTGSILYTGNISFVSLELVAPQDREFDNNSWLSKIEKQDLRYFSGMEMARLFGFDPSFSFPQDCTIKQQWKLVGNSLNSRLAARLIKLGLIVLGNDIYQ